MFASMKKYKLIAKKGEGSFSEVIKAQHVDSGNYYAIKCMKCIYRNYHEVNNLREIRALRKLTPHPNIVNLEEILFDSSTGHLGLVFELMFSNLYEAIEGRRTALEPSLIKRYGYQLFLALDHMHSNGIFHRDIKPENILLDATREEIKVADFGSCRGVHNRQPYTEYISTRWYRAPECLLTNGHYGAEMDVWAVGCVLFEVIALYPLFPGSNEADQMHSINKVLGPPPQQVISRLLREGKANSGFNFPARRGTGIAHLIPQAAADCVDLLTRSLMYDLDNRLTARQGIQHLYFSEFGEYQSMERFSGSEKEKHLKNEIQLTPKAKLLEGRVNKPLPQLRSTLPRLGTKVLPGKSITPTVSMNKTHPIRLANYGTRPSQTTGVHVTRRKPTPLQNDFPSRSMTRKLIPLASNTSSSALPPLFFRKQQPSQVVDGLQAKYMVDQEERGRKGLPASLFPPPHRKNKYSGVRSSGYGQSQKRAYGKYVNVRSSGYGQRPRPAVGRTGISPTRRKARV